MAYFEYRHVIGFEDTNVVGNVYYATHVRLQGRCRELFLREVAPEVVSDLRTGLSFVTMRVSCEYLQELELFDEVVLRMRLDEVTHHRMRLHFEYWRIDPRASDDGVGSREELVARGEQQLACIVKTDGAAEPAMWPAALLEALKPYTETRHGA